jgi:hypothetical protein
VDQVWSDMTYENLGRVLGRALTPWQVASLFPGLFLHNKSIGLDTGVGTCVVCQSWSPIFQRPHIQCCHLLQSEVGEVEPYLELCLESQFRVGRHGRWDVLLRVGLEVGE